MKVLAFDFGGSTGRAVVGEIADGKLIYNEIKRFDNIPFTKDGHMRWDFDSLWENVLASIALANDVDAIGIDTWGVDFGIIGRDGELKEEPVHYRDKRTDGAYNEIVAKYGKEELYKRTGIEVLKINTMFQLVAANEEGLLADAGKVLFMPDLFAYMLTGVMRSEYTIATTSGLIDPESRGWNYPLIDELGLDRNIFADLIMTGECYGNIKKDILKSLGIEKDIKVIAVCTHDTASAITAMPADTRSSIYISSGTWSLMGVERDAVSTRNSGFTNEGGYMGSVTYLKNIMGLWLMQELRRKFKGDHPNITFKDMDVMMEGTEEGKYVVDTNDEAFVAPADMEEAIKEYVRSHNMGEIKSRGELVRLVYDSLAHTYAETARSLNEMYGGVYDTINIFGGGSSALALAEATAKATGLKVVAGPKEATAIGNMLVSLISLGEIADIEEARDIVRRSENVKTVMPPN